MIPEVIKNILIQLEHYGFEAYLVGGFVRDFLLQYSTNDFDIATNALPKDLIQIFGPSKHEYGSFHLKIENYNVDITTYRKESVYKNRKPISFSYTNNLILDAKRRDFTMNALYMNKNGDILDPLEVKEDLKHKRLRMIGNPSLRFKEDPLRILRAVRFASMYSLTMEKNLVQAIKKEKKLLFMLSKERIKKELDLILLSNGFSLLKKLDLLKTLGIQNKKMVYVEDLGGLWAQIQCSFEYPKEKKFKRREKVIKNQIKYDTMNMLFLYHNGYYDSLIVSKIIHFPVKKLEKMAQNLAIHSRRDIVLSIEEVEKIFSIHGVQLGTLYRNLEENIVLGKIKNERASILKYITEVTNSCQI